MLLVVKYRFFSQQVYFWLLTIFAVSLAFSPLASEICLGLLFVNWLLEGNWEVRINKFQHHKSLWIFMSIFFIYLLWLPLNSNLSVGWSDVLTKLPFLVLPLIIATSEILENSKIRLLLRFFIGSVVVTTIISIAVYNKIISYKINDIREISIFIPHFQLSILIVIAILTILHWIKSEGRFVGKHHLLYIFIIVWLVFFLFLIKSLSGVIILGFTMFVLILILLNTIENQFLKVWLIIVMYAIPFFSLVAMLNAYNSFYENKDGDLQKLDLKTINGVAYYHDSTSQLVENGHRVMIYLCEPELQNQWKRRSHFDFNGLDYKNQPLKQTLIRYLTSKGLRKDSVGIWSLTARDIANIEEGMTNYIFEKNWSIYPRIYEAIWELHHFRISGENIDKSIVKRIVFSEIAFKCIKEKPLVGYGNTDVQEVISKNNVKNISTTSEDLIHNQYLRVIIGFGFIGFMIFMVAFLLPPFLERRWPSYYFLMIFMILFLAFFSDDILETAVGVNVMAFFYSLFLWGSHRRLL